MKVLLAVSGGIDSMCMADMYSRTECDYAIAHCNFHLRDKDSDADADLVQKWARSHGVRFFCADFDTVGYAEAKGISIEMAAREQRYAWFSFIAETQGFDAVATAHNANDNAETLILNLLRGTGSRGLRGISHNSPLSGKEGVRLIRPMLGMSRKEIEVYVKEHGVQYREDRTNKESVYKRNRIRNIIFPEFEKINPSFVNTLNADMERFRQVDDIAEDYFRENAGKVMEGNSISVSGLLKCRHWQYILFRLLEPCGFSAQVLESITTLLADIAEGKDITFSGKRFESAGFVLETSSDAITILEAAERLADSETVTVDATGIYEFSGRKIIIEEQPFEPGMDLRQDKGVLICDAEALPFPFTLRKWKAGDWMRPFGMGGKSKKISDLFTDLKLSLTEKESAVMIASDSFDPEDPSHVAAAAGYRMDEALRITKGSKHIIKISIL